MYNVERWSGKAWYPSMCSPYKTMGEVNKHLTQYWWHYTDSNPYRITNLKPKKVVRRSSYKHFQDWNSDKGMAVMY